VIAAFGREAARYESVLRAAGLGDLDAVISDVDSLLSAHSELRSRRYEGRSTYGMILLRDKRWQAIADYTPALLQQFNQDSDLQGEALSALSAGTLTIEGSGAASGSLWTETIDESSRWIVGEFCLLADTMLVRSFAEYGRLVPFMKRPRAVETIVAEPALSPFERRPVNRPSVVIWAPARKPGDVAYHAFGLREFHGDVTCVTAAGSPVAGIAARFIERADPALIGVLEMASCVVCVDPDDPGDAVAFARRGYGVVSPLTSGAYEFVRNVVSLQGDHLREVYIATMLAAGQPASVRPIARPPAAPEKPAMPAHSGELPLVSIITPTYNRRADLPIMLNCLAAQTYPRIEAIIVNDAGEDIDDIVARYPFARVLHSPVNVGTHGAVVHVGLPAMTGEYVATLCDDDLFMPDHIERMVAAMLRSGMAIAHGNANIRYQEKNGKGEIVTSGSNVSIFTDTATPSEALVSTPIAGHALVYRRDAWDAFGGMSPESDLADQEMQLRALRMYNFVYVDAVTCDWGIREDRNFSARVDSGRELRRLFDEVYPLPDRPFVREQRERILAIVAGRPKGKVAFEPTIRWSG
jgi:glycosyltransferase involved in cell wall biosynthesis